MGRIKPWFTRLSTTFWTWGSRGLRRRACSAAFCARSFMPCFEEEQGELGVEAGRPGRELDRALEGLDGFARVTGGALARKRPSAAW